MTDENLYSVKMFYRLNGNEFMTVKHFQDIATAREFRLTAIRTIGNWPPRGSEDAEVGDIHGPDIIIERPDRATAIAGIAQMRQALENATGPLFGSVRNPVGYVDNKRRGSGERVAV